MTSYNDMQMCENRPNCDGCFYRTSCIWREAFYFDCYDALKTDAIKIDLSKKSNHSQIHVHVIRSFYRQLDEKRKHEKKIHTEYSER